MKRILCFRKANPHIPAHCRRCGESFAWWKEIVIVCEGSIRKPYHLFCFNEIETLEFLKKLEEEKDNANSN